MSSTNSGPVALREKQLKDGRTSLYLDIYLGGNRKYEFLKLYLVPAKTKQDRDHNKQTRQLAEAIKAKRTLEIQNGTFGFTSNANITLLAYFDARIEEVEKSLKHKTVINWRTTRAHLANSGIANTRLSAVTADTVNAFIDYLRSVGLSPNSVDEYLHKFKACLGRAIADGQVRANALSKANKVKTTAAERAYLTIEEVKALTATPCHNQEIRRAFLFSCLTGLRKSDIEALTWAEVSEVDGLTRITYRQRKTGGQEYLDISPNAVPYLGARPDDDAANVFRLPTSTPLNMQLAAWVRAAGIRKHITFHCARHTFATLMLSLGVDLFTVSKLLGHSDIATTQVYAKIMDEGKRDAVRRLPDIET